MASKDRLIVSIGSRAELEILFRQLVHPVPTGWKPGFHWQVEAYEYGLEQPPIGFCWIADTSSNLPTNRKHEAYPPHVEYIRVFHTHARSGVATALLDAVRQRWPNIELTPDVSPDGNAFMAAYLDHAEKQGAEGKAFADRNRHVVLDPSEPNLSDTEAISS